jgi:uncharacterized protein (TIGR02996 family)
MSNHAAFIRAICAAPADDLPRLVFADWLDEHTNTANPHSPAAEHFAPLP